MHVHLLRTPLRLSLPPGTQTFKTQSSHDFIYPKKVVFVVSAGSLQRWTADRGFHLGKPEVQLNANLRTYFLNVISIAFTYKSGFACGSCGLRQ